MSLSNVIAETKDFQLEIGAMKIVPEFLKEETGYRLRNKRTGIVEQEGNCEASAIRAMHSNQEWLEKVLKDPTGEKEPKQPETLQDLQAFLGDNEPPLPGEIQ